MVDRVLILQFWAALIGIVSPISSSFQKLYAALISLRSSMASFFQQQNPPSFFTRKHLAFSMYVILGFLQVVSPGMATSLMQSNPKVYYVAVNTFLIYVIAFAIETSSSSSRLPRWATNSLRWCMFFASSLSFAATASLLFGNSAKLVILVLILIIISACALLFWVHEIQIESGWVGIAANYSSQISGCV